MVGRRFGEVRWGRLQDLQAEDLKLWVWDAVLGELLLEKGEGFCTIPPEQLLQHIGGIRNDE